MSSTGSNQVLRMRDPLRLTSFAVLLSKGMVTIGG